MPRSNIRNHVALLTLALGLVLVGMGCVHDDEQDTDKLENVSTSSCSPLIPVDVTASGNDGNVPGNVLDGDLSTRWSSRGSGQFITADLGVMKTVCAVQIAWYASNRRIDFTIALSGDGTSFTQVFAGRSSGTTSALETYNVTSGSARYVRVTVNGNQKNQWASVTELRAGVTDSAATPTGITLFTTQIPAVSIVDDIAAVELGVKFRSSESGRVSAIRFYRGVANPSGYIVKLYNSTGTELARATAPSGTTGWQEVAFANPPTIVANTIYVASYYTSGGRYAATNNGFAEDFSRAPLTAPASAAVGGNGVYRYGVDGGFPDSTFQASNYFVDVVFSSTSTPPPTDDTTLPAIAFATPTAGATVSATTTVSGTASDNVALANVTLQVDGGPFVAASGTSSWSYAWDTTTLPNGTHSLTARATDTSGNTKSTTISVTVNNGATIGFSLTKAWFQANTGPRLPPDHVCNGSMTSANAGATFSRCIFPNGIDGNGVDNITIIDSLVQGPINLGWESLGGSVGWKIHFTELDGRALTSAESVAIGMDGFDIYRTEIYGFVNGIRFSGGNTNSNRIVENYIHDLTHRDPDAHRSCIGSNGATGPKTTLIQRNWIDCTGDTVGVSGALVMYGDFGQITNVTLEGNYLDGSGSYTLYAGSISGKAYPVSSNVDVIGNRWGRVHQYGPLLGWSSAGGGMWSDNAYADNGQIINP
jgi:hypothetical protein